MNRAPEVSIIVSNYNSSDLINGALESVVATAGDVSFEVVLIDDASTDGGFTLVSDVYKQDSRFVFVQNEKNVGYAALNVLQSRLHGEFYMTLDTDARLLPGALQSLVTFMRTHPHAGGATANLRNPDGSTQNYYRRLMTPTRGFYTTVPGRFLDKYFFRLKQYKSYHYDDLDVSRVFEIEQPPTACLMFRPEALDTPVLDSEYRFLFLDVDLCHRIYQKGFKLYLVPDAQVTHIKSVSFGRRTTASRERQYYRDLNVFFKKHYTKMHLFMRALLWVDRVLRMLLERTVGHVPMR